MIEFTEDTDGYAKGTRHAFTVGIEDAYVVHRRTAKYVREEPATAPAQNPAEPVDPKPDAGEKFSDVRADKMTRPEQVKRK